MSSSARTRRAEPAVAGAAAAMSQVGAAATLSGPSRRVAAEVARAGDGGPSNTRHSCRKGDHQSNLWLPRGSVAQCGATSPAGGSQFLLLPIPRPAMTTTHPPASPPVTFRPPCTLGALGPSAARPGPGHSGPRGWRRASGCHSPPPPGRGRAAPIARRASGASGACGASGASRGIAHGGRLRPPPPPATSAAAAAGPACAASHLG